MNFGQIKSLLHQPIKWNSTLLFDYLDPIKDARHLDKQALVQKLANNGKVRKRFNFHYLVPFTLALFTYTYGNIGLEYAHRGTFEPHRWPQSPYPMDHQMFPPEVWKFSSMSMIFSTSAVLIIFASFTINPLDESIRYYIVRENVIWTRGKGWLFINSEFIKFPF